MLLLPRIFTGRRVGKDEERVVPTVCAAMKNVSVGTALCAFAHPTRIGAPCPKKFPSWEGWTPKADGVVKGAVPLRKTGGFETRPYAGA